MSLMACGNKETIVPNTLGGTYVSAFNDSSASDAAGMVDYLMTNVPDDYGLVSMEVEPGFLNGFDNDIQGFSKGVMFAPMIGSIPFVGYVFETEDADTLEQTLKDNANMRWNVCTEADELVTAKKGNLVFFLMCANDEQ